MAACDNRAYRAIREVPGVPVISILARHDLLHPADGIKAPAKQVVPHLLKPFLHAVGVLASPDMHVLSIHQGRRIDMIQPDGKERPAFGRNEPPSPITLANGEESLGVDLRGWSSGNRVLKEM